MARTVQAKPIKPGTRAAAPAKAAASKSARPASAGRQQATSARPPAISKDALRAQVEKLERANATLRTRSREANRAAKTDSARIAELEDEVARLQKQLAAQQRAAERSRNPREPRAIRAARERDPGDAVPSGVAVAEPAPLDEEAKAALEGLNEHLGGE